MVEKEKDNACRGTSERKKKWEGEKIETKKSEHDDSWFRSTIIAIPIIKLQNYAANQRTKSTVTSYINIIEKICYLFY